jgi:hypothetical protein
LHEVPWELKTDRYSPQNTDTFLHLSINSFNILSIPIEAHLYCTYLHKTGKPERSTFSHKNSFHIDNELFPKLVKLIKETRTAEKSCGRDTNAATVRKMK